MSLKGIWVKFLPFLLILLGQDLEGQNLVPNGDFSEFINCPDNVSQIERAAHWDNPSEGSPDFYHGCAGEGPCNSCVPYYLRDGYQESSFGNAYSGLFTVFFQGDSLTEYREYIQTQLLTPLIAGREYQFTMYICHADSCETVSNAPQVYFSQDSFTRATDQGFYDLVPQVVFDTIITEKDIWTRLTACYTAVGNEEFISIGNFLDNEETTLDTLLESRINSPYYLIDLVSVLPVDFPADSLLPENVTLCEGDTFKVTLPGGLDYVWSDGSTDNPRFITRTGRYIVTGSSNCIPQVSDTIIVRFDDRLDTRLPDSVFICENGDIRLDLGTGFDSQLWSDGSTADTFLITQPGLYWVEVTNECGTARDSIFATRILDPVSSLPSDTIFCEGDSLWLTADPELNPIWEGNNFTDSFLIREAGTYVLELSNFCDIVTDIIRVETLPRPEIDLGQDRFFCEGDSANVVPRVIADEWSWLDGTADSIRWIKEEGWIGIEAVSECGTIRDSVFIEEIGPPLSPFLGDTTLCEGKFWEISLPEDWDVRWSDGSTASDYLIDGPGTYSVEIGNACGSVSDSVNVEYIFLPDLELESEDLRLCLGDSVIVVAESVNGTVQWDDSTSTGNSLLVDSEGIYRVTAFNECGSVEGEVEVDVVNCGCRVYIPNAFSPNGDNINDELEVFAACELENIQMQIYSRWGELIFQSSPGNTFWDGRFEGEPLPPDVYVFYVQYEIAGDPFSRSGSVTLVR